MQLVKSSMSVKERATNGLKILLGKTKPFSQIQGAWRFLNNKNVTTKALFNPIFENLQKEIKDHCKSYVLVMSDWSHLDYKKHTSKKELISKKKKENGKQIGYDLQTSIAVSDITGEPIAPIVHNLKTSDKIYSTYNDEISIDLKHLEELSLRATWIKDNLSTKKPIVHIVDRESDSVAFMREMQKNENLFLLRVKNNSKLYYPKEDINIKQGDLADKLPLGQKVKSIKYRKKKVKIYVNECDVEVKRDASTFIISDSGKKRLQKTPGNTIKARFVVERLVDDKGKIVAQWLLITNILDKNVSAQTLATWYYYRWKIESYFKLLKTSGFNLEQWQQEEPIALFRRLLVVSYACVLVWKIANDRSENAKKIRDFLVLLSGKLIERGTDFTHPALLTGLWAYLQIMDIMELFSRDELLDIKRNLVHLMGVDI
jgi:CRISPR/Cas system endoribonuclease Cas6 (RAMP superfamily)